MGESEKSDGGAESSSGNQTDRRPSPKDVAALLLQEVPARSERSDEKLKAALAGSIAVSITDKNERYRGAWEGSRLQIKKDKDTASDCTISTTEKNLMKISDGSLNPQIAMLSGKVSVSGNAQLGIYFFNLVAPRSSQAI